MGIRDVLGVALVALAVSAAPAAAAPPANDAWADARVLDTALPISLRGTNVDATKEAGEPDHAGETGGTSVWYRWTPDRDGQVGVATCLSTFDTLVGVYTGDGVPVLTEIASDDQGCQYDYFSNGALAFFDATAGTTYWIAVDGWEGAQGAIAMTLAWSPPLNDDFEDGQLLAGELPIRAPGATLYASYEPGEPSHDDFSFKVPSVWYRWTPDFTGKVIIETCQVEFDSVLTVYQGTRVDDLTRVAKNDEASCGFEPVGSRVRMAVVAGETYRIGVSGFFGSIGYFALRLARPPVNDDFADARDVSGPLPIVLTDTNFDAASEPGEARHAGNAARTSVWFRWTAPTTGPAVIDTCGSDFDTRLGVYTGTSVDALAEIAAGDDDCGQAGRATFDAVSGTTYRIAVDGFLAAGGRDTGSIAMRIDQPPLPPAAPAMSLTQTTPASPANDTGPRVTGTAPDGAEIRLYRNDATCTGLPAATGTAFELAGSGIAVEVPDDSSTAIRATATVDGRTSACSEPLEYVEDSTVPATPTLLGTFVLKDRPPLVMGLADAGTTVRLYVNNATCAGQPAAVGSAAEFAGPGLAVPLKGAARIRATAADPGGSSGCSSVLAYSGPSASCAGLPATLVGTEHDDLIRGTPRRDIVAGLGGNDELRGLRGHDILCGGPGDDLLLGGRGVDEFHGGSGKDTPRQERT